MSEILGGTVGFTRLENTEFTLLASGARSSSTTTEKLENKYYKGVYICLNVSAAPGGDTVAIYVRGYDQISGSVFNLLQGSNISTTGLNTYLIHPGVGLDEDGSSLKKVVPWPLTRNWDVQVYHSGSGSFTYSLSGCYLP